MKKLFVVLFLLGTFVQGFAQSADAVIKEYLNAIGGLDKLKKIQTLKFTGNFQQGGMNFPFIMYQKRPDKTLIEVTFQGMTQKIAYDGSEAWMINPFQGRSNAEKMDADGAKQQKYQADIDGPFVDYAAKGYKVEYVGEEDIEGAPAIHLRLITKEEDVHDYYFDKETYLLIKDKAHIKSQDGSVSDSETNYSDYKEVEGVLMPFTTENVSEYQGQKYSAFVKIETAEVNTAMDEAMFKMPAAGETPTK